MSPPFHHSDCIKLKEAGHVEVSEEAVKITTSGWGKLGEWDGMTETIPLLTLAVGGSLLFFVIAFVIRTH